MNVIEISNLLAINILQLEITYPYTYIDQNERTIMYMLD